MRKNSSPLLIAIVTADIISGELKARDPPPASNIFPILSTALVKMAGQATASMLVSQRSSRTFKGSSSSTSLKRVKVIYPA